MSEERKPVYAFTLPVTGARIRQFQFDNGYGASLSKPPNSYLWDLAVTIQPSDELVENAGVFPGSVLCGITWIKAMEMLELIALLEPKPEWKK